MSEPFEVPLPLPSASYRLTVQELTDVLRKIEENRKRLFCGPSVAEDVREFVRVAGAGLYFEVVVSSLLEGCGYVVLGPSVAEAQAMLNMSVQAMMDDMFVSGWPLPRWEPGDADGCAGR